MSNFRPLVDCHNHSHHSFDATETVEVMCRQAEELGLLAFALTDHCDIGVQTEEKNVAAISACVDELTALRNREQFSCALLTGLELGEVVDDIPCGERLLNLRDYDIVIGSIHNGSEVGDFYWLDTTGYRSHPEDLTPILEDYFNRILRLIQWGKFDVLAHLTYPLRYIVGDGGIPVDLSRFNDQIDEIFLQLIKKNISLELNTSGLSQKIGEPLPNRSLLTRYHRLGGTLLCMGSDAHSVPHISRGMGDCLALLQEIGFETINYYQKRQPVFVKISDSIK